MKILGIIVEYNPFHTGHLYHLQKAKEMVKPDLTIAIMSGNYVQRGEVAIIDKFKRSELAIKYGVDLVIELPFAYVCQSADYFCKGAIDLLILFLVVNVVTSILLKKSPMLLKIILMNMINMLKLL